MIMNINVKLFGTFSQDSPGYDPQRGLQVELPNGARVDDLLALLGLIGDKTVVAVDNRIRSSQDELQEGADVHVLQVVFGG